ncbi:hypothetical protein FL966_11595 [Caproiciproducens galactitolivorans]|uniref:Uncharacterized protein n=1 Tax=Caproiciproducens galactitolivorans TaxID=642589 RepID=A0A4Z0YBR0_9FIRM|nr:hypothetical protein [Caproiciproducens galactitolivorans]QEY35649.1 hypothetical protein FL966_11595 [Caproiciproducens galactitolivorans]TGJ77378.1 hypothetical protein CAGA_07480 [Caproiciproducens galactitolivorans]
MKKRIRALSMVLALSLVIAVFGNTAAFAADATQITFPEETDALQSLQLNSIYYGLEVNVSNPDVTLSAVSSDPSIVKIEEETDTSGSGAYYYDLEARLNGVVTLTFTTSDGVSATKTLTVEGTGEPTYTLSSDVTGNFSLNKGSSRIVKVHFENNDVDTYSYPTLSAQNGKVLKTTLVNTDEDNGDYYFRVDAVGTIGQSDDLYLGAYGFIPNKLCTVSIIQNKDLRLDTTTEYICNTGDKYHFIAYTNSGINPQIMVDNENISVTFVTTVYGGYEYEMEALEPGTALITATLNGETASFPVTVNEEDDFPSVVSDAPAEITLSQGESHTYKITAMGGGVPIIVPGTDGVVSVQFEKKEGIDYYFQVTAIGEVDSQTNLSVMFPDSTYDDYSVDLGSITIKEGAPAPQSDTNSDFTLKKGESYTFKISNASSFYAGSSNVFQVVKVSTSGSDAYYKITAIGNPGQSAGFYMSAPGYAPQKVCVVTVGQAAPQSDTNSDFTLKKGESYTFKISNASSFYAGSSNVFQVVKVSTSGSDAYYKITAIGNPGQSAGFYMSAPGYAAQKVCVVTVGQAAAPKSDTNSDFTLKKGASYTFKISNATSFYPGSSNIFQVAKVSTSGSDAYYKITAIGNPGQSAGFYMSAPGYASQKVCVITVGAPDSVSIQSDTNLDFSLAKGASYQFKITAPGASSITFNPGTAGVFQVTFLRRTGNDFFYKITAIGKSGQQAGIYASASGQVAKKLCVVTIK